MRRFLSIVCWILSIPFLVLGILGIASGAGFLLVIGIIIAAIGLKIDPDKTPPPSDLDDGSSGGHDY